MLPHGKNMSASSRSNATMGQSPKNPDRRTSETHQTVGSVGSLVLGTLDLDSFWEDGSRLPGTLYTVYIYSHLMYIYRCTFFAVLLLVVHASCMPPATICISFLNVLICSHVLPLWGNGLRRSGTKPSTRGRGSGNQWVALFPESIAKGSSGKSFEH